MATNGLPKNWSSKMGPSRYGPPATPKYYDHMLFLPIKPRSGGAYMKRSSAYPKGFGMALLREHQQFLEAYGDLRANREKLRYKGPGWDIQINYPLKIQKRVVAWRFQFRIWVFSTMPWIAKSLNFKTPKFPQLPVLQESKPATQAIPSIDEAPRVGLIMGI